MQDIIVLKPYNFVPARRSGLVQWLILAYLDRYMRKKFRIESHEVLDVERLRASVDADHGVLIAVNHSRLSDPTACGWLRIALGAPLYVMTSRHLFEESRLQRFLIQCCGGFSVNREAADHTSLNYAIKSIIERERPVLVFPEGCISRSNDYIQPLLDGTAWMARMAARRRAKQSPPGKVVVHPVAMKYSFHGDVERSLVPVLERIEQRLAWQALADISLLDRVRKIAEALLCLKEIEYVGAPQQGNGQDPIHDRKERLIERILNPLEEEWTSGEQNPNGTYGRVQRLRGRIVAEMIEGALDEQELARRWRQLTDCYVANQLACYPRGYLGDHPTNDRIVETVERLEEDLTDVATAHGPLHLAIKVGEAIEVSSARRDKKEEALTEQIRTSLTEMIHDTSARHTA